MPEFGERLQAPLSEKDRARVREIEAKEEAGTATPEESLEDFRLVWPSYFADPASAPPMPEMDMAVQPFTATMASIAEHSEAGTLVRGLPAVPPEIPVLFLHGAASPMPLRASTRHGRADPTRPCRDRRGRRPPRLARAAGRAARRHLPACDI
jgi:hypothetical protein